MMLTAESRNNQRITYSGATLPTTGTGLGSTNASLLRGWRLTARVMAELRLQKYKPDSRNAWHFNCGCHVANISPPRRVALKKLMDGPEARLFRRNPKVYYWACISTQLSPKTADCNPYPLIRIVYEPFQCYSFIFVVGSQTVLCNSRFPTTQFLDNKLIPSITEFSIFLKQEHHTCSYTHDLVLSKVINSNI